MKANSNSINQFFKHIYVKRGVSTVEANMPRKIRTIIQYGCWKTRLLRGGPLDFCGEGWRNRLGEFFFKDIAGDFLSGEIFFYAAKRALEPDFWETLG